jgi:putative FmdB family regulatory protein
MPIYEYQCSKCGFQTEVLQKISDAPLKKCPECGKSAMQKMVSAPSFRLKGSGWYETDFKSGNKKNVVESGGDKKSSAKKEPAKKASGGSSATTQKADSSKK